MCSVGIVQRFANLCRNFIGNRAGNMTMMLALAAIPVVGAVGAGVDYARVSRETTQLHATVDSALLAIITSDRSDLTGLNASDKAARLDELESMAEEFLAANYQPEHDNPGTIDASIVINDDDVTMTANHTMKMSLMSFLGVPTIDIKVVSEAKRSQNAVVPTEIALVMDTTGSMGSTYMGQARTAARTLLNTIYGGNKTAEPENPNIRVALVPFAAAVRLDTSAYDFDLDWIDTTGEASVSKVNFSDPAWHNYRAWQELNNVSWNGCVEARARGSAPFDYNTNDDPPVSGNTLFTPYFAPDEPTFSGSTRRPYNFDNSYIGNSGNPREYTGISSSTSSSNHENRQKNVNKYDRNISTSSSYGPWYNCAKSAVVPMTYDRNKIEDGITAMTSAGNTVIPQGLAWGWRALSPTEPLTKVEAGPSIPASTISDYGSKWAKVLVLMTDGEIDINSSLNTLNGNSYNAYGFVKAPIAKNRFGTTTASAAEGKLYDDMLQLCENIKDEGITIFTVAFRVSSSTILNKLKTCATTVDDHYSYAATGTELAQVFEKIGETVKARMVYLSK